MLGDLARAARADLVHAHLAAVRDRELDGVLAFERQLGGDGAHG
ncbi:MAG: hypothetical protein QM820_56275 [Minicystis sp.]